MDTSYSDISDDSDNGMLNSKKFVGVVLPPGYDPNREIETAMDYLQKVKYESMTLPSVAKCVVDTSSANDCGYYDVICRTLIPEKRYQIPNELLPSLEWQKEQLERFKEFRLYVHKKLPTERDFFGSIKKFEELFHTKYPNLNDVKTLYYKPLQELIEKCTEHLKLIEPQCMFNDCFGAWILCLLTLVDDPINSSLCYSMRELCKECIRIRYHLYVKNGNQLDEVETKPLNMFICIITKYFLQRDLTFA